jgi:hypothetical protein
VAGGMNKDVAKATASLLTAGASAAIAGSVGGVQGATTGFNVDLNNRQLHPSERTRIGQLAKDKAKADCNGRANCETQVALYWTDMLERAAGGRVDDAEAAKNQQYYQQVINAASIPGTEASFSNGSVNFFNNLESAQRLLNADAGKPILDSSGLPVIGNDGKPQTYFNATTAQRADAYGNIFPGGSPSSVSSVIPGKDQRDVDRLERLKTLNGSATPIYPVEELLLGGAVASKIPSVVGRVLAPTEGRTAINAAEEAAEAAGKYANRTNVQYRTAEDVNTTAFTSEYRPPYQAGTRVTEYVTKDADQFVRVSAGDNASGQWMMRKEAIAGLSPEEIARKYSLPSVPKYIVDIEVPAGTKIRTGHVESNFNGNQGAIQYQLLGRIPNESFTNVRPIR